MSAWREKIILRGRRLPTEWLREPAHVKNSRRIFFRASAVGLHRFQTQMQVDCDL